jgi:hypothetical protein
MEKTYNGWTNYETWRVNLEVFDGSEGYWDHHSAKEFAEEIIYNSTSEGLGRDHALAFLANVNWYEIAEHYSEFDETGETLEESEA